MSIDENGIDLLSLGSLEELEALNMNVQDGCSPDLSFMEGLSQLRKLDITVGGGVDLTPLGELRGLQQLSISTWSGDALDLSFLERLSCVEEITVMKCCELSNLSVFRYMSSLRKLDVSYVEVKIMVKQTAGRDQLGDFAPKFAQLNDDVLFGEVWSREEKHSLRDRSLVTVVSLMAQGLVDSSFRYHLMSAKNNGIIREEIAEILTHAAFYAGWPKAWAAFKMAKEVWTEEDVAGSAKEAHEKNMLFPVGNPNDEYAQYFIGQSYLAPLSTEQVGIFNVTFEPGCRNNWHIHHATSGGGQILICVGGRGYYQEWGKEAQELNPGDVINIPAGVKHWHGAAPDSWFSHLAVEVFGTEVSNEWLEAVDDTSYGCLK